MDLNALLGNGEGSWNYNARKGAEERDRERQAAATLLEILSRTDEIKQKQRHADAKLPGELERQSLDNILAKVQGQTGQHNLDIGRRFDAPMKEATLANQKATTEKTQLENSQAAGAAFINDVAAVVAANGSASPQQIMAAAKKYNLDENHVLVRTLLSADPAKQAQLLPKTQLSSTAHRQKVDELGIQGQNSARVAGINAAGGVQQAAISAAAQSDPAKMSTDQAIAFAYNQIRQLNAALAASRNPREVDNIQIKLQEWMDHAKRLEASKEQTATAGVRARSAADDATLQRILDLAGRGGGGAPTQPQAGVGPQGQGTIVRDFNSLPE